MRTAAALSICTVLALSASLAVAQGPSPAGMMLYKSLPLSGRMSGIVRIQCTDSTHCSIDRATQQVSGADGTLQVWQDAGIDARLRSKLWGQKGGPIVFGGQPAHPALLVLRAASGAIVAQSMAETALVDVEPLFLGASTPSFLISINYRTPQAAGISRGILQVDPASASLTYATYSGPKSMPVMQPDGLSATVAVPGPDAVIAFDNNFDLQTNASAHTAVLTTMGCYPNRYINYRTRISIETVLTVHARYELRDGTWVRDAKLSYDNCNGQYRDEDLKGLNVEHN